MKIQTHDLCGRQTPPRFGQLRRSNEKTDKRAAPPTEARPVLICASARGARPVLICASYRGAARFIFCRSRLLAAAVFYFTIRHAANFSNFFTPVCCGGLLFHYPARGKFFKLFYACLLRRTIKVQAPLTSYSPTAEMQKQSPAAKGSSPRFHLKCPPPVRTRSTSSPSVNSL